MLRVIKWAFRRGQADVAERAILIIDRHIANSRRPDDLNRVRSQMIETFRPVVNKANDDLAVEIAEAGTPAPTIEVSKDARS